MTGDQRTEGAGTPAPSPRGPERRRDERRHSDQSQHYLEQGVLAAAVAWRQTDGGLEPEALGQRIKAARALRDAVDLFLAHAERGQASAVSLVLGAVVLAAFLVPTTLLGAGSWGRWLAAMAGLLACLALLLRNARAQPRSSWQRYIDHVHDCPACLSRHPAGCQEARRLSEGLAR